ncbi:hypothetical protein BHL83_03090 [Limosilactobacillus reuteri]|uniref:Uncharacterized protein n=2 Tax=Limosilactobacillus reuteri TaxID=1598 RepID=A0AAE5J9T3_LIMRT|nr:hypothetical protein [Limosilactobacillus reuteri]AGO00124.1 hypothetical protein LRI_1914 [Limosilactobacillus reuteri I5007]EQC57915.1 hypothetical protein N219_12515 [Limosilactobacillus fermentum MTCC 8711]MDY6042797.1 hypothetical protein [Lactobacillus johnsonii]OJI11675.1 hypothetical protein BJI45_00235 [Limosilactobacillus reuteri]OTA44432.1 hypothetical protein BHL85_07315 [Limosilactobacillus reuteri]
MRYVLEIEKRVDNISEKTAALIGNDFIDLTSEKIISEEQDENIVFKNVLNNNETFNEAFSINIFDTERSEILNTEFEYEDNLKTALLFYCVKQEIPFSTVLSFKTTMNIVSKEEKSIDKAFRNFNQDDIISFAKNQIEQGSSVYTANNRIYLLSRLVKELHEFAGEYLPESKKVYDETFINIFLKTTKNYATQEYGNTAMANGEIPFVTIDDVHEVMERKPASIGAIFVLIFRGLRENKYNKEISTLKVGDIKGNQITINGDMPRTIYLAEDEARYVGRLCKGASENDYVFRNESPRLTEQEKQQPLKTWALLNKRMRQVDNILGKKPTYSMIRRSGEVYYIANQLKRELNANADKIAIIRAIDKSFREYGVIPMDSQNIMDYKGNSGIAKRRRQMTNLYKKYTEYVTV